VKPGETSMTARRVAAYRLSFSRQPATYGNPTADDRLQIDVATGVRAGSGTATYLARYLRARTAFFDRVVIADLDRGLDQVVTLGAGYDGRSLRYARPGVSWFELDHPDTQVDKLTRLRRLEIGTDGVVFVPIDFRTGDVATVLRRAGQRPDRPTLFLCEGVAEYLHADVLSRLLRSAAAAAAPGSRLAISLALQPVSLSGRARRTLLNSAVSRVGEPLMNAIPQGELGQLMNLAGWTILKATDPAGSGLRPGSGNSAFVLAAVVVAA
jgi:methyltransferase (TIGR00027 family)